MMQRKDLGRGAWMDIDQRWLDEDDATALLTELIDTEWVQRPILVFGREIMQPRLISWAGELPYKYSGQTLPIRPLTDTLSKLCRAASDAADTEFNHVLLNRYRDGNDHMSYHADNEPELGKDPVIGALSVGFPRYFRLRRKDKRRNHKVLLRHGSLLVMGGNIQHTWRHAVPKMAHAEGERINITFRRLLGPPGWRSKDARRPPRGGSSDQASS
jgi:alkylated DNA repair dioxygenase AlkB